MENKIASFTAASVFPAKLLANAELVRKIMKEKKIPPIHVQLNVTNRCNLNCQFCSCSKRDRKLELSCEEIMEIMKKARKAGCKSCTITGGGEPLMHPRISDIIRGINAEKIEIGLVTNGLLLGQVPADVFKRITWIRVSSADDREFTDEYGRMLGAAVERGMDVDWAFSHVVGSKPNYDTIVKIIKFANNYAFTHVRLVSDLLDLNAVEDMSTIKRKLKKRVDDSLVIYQGRKTFERGKWGCYISLLKPVITPDGRIVACCGWQYRKKNPSRDYDTKDSMGLAKDIDKLYEKQAWQACFDGSGCDRCYYMDYNRALKILLSDLRHKEFV